MGGLLSSFLVWVCEEVSLCRYVSLLMLLLLLLVSSLFRSTPSLVAASHVRLLEFRFEIESKDEGEKTAQQAQRDCKRRIWAGSGRGGSRGIVRGLVWFGLWGIISQEL